MTAVTTSAPTAAEPSTRRRRPVGRIVLAAVAALIVSGVAALLLLGSRSSGAPLDPDNPQPPGGQAMARVLSDQGVSVHPVRSREALRDSTIGAGTSVVVTRGEVMTLAMWKAFFEQTRSADRIILVTPGDRALRALDAPISRRGAGFPRDTPARCDVPIARGLTITDGSERYDPADGSGVQTCFPPGGGFGQGGDRGGYLAVLPATADRPEIVLLGSTAPIRNSDVRDAGHAALGLRALGHSSRLVWWSVSPRDVDLVDAKDPVWPKWMTPVGVVLALSVLVLMVSRGRRLGRLVQEPLPVVVRASETTESRGQLYRKAGDRERAATVLRSGTRRRVSRYLGVPPGSSPAALVDAVAGATGRAPMDVHTLLFTAVPTDDAGLTQLAQQLRQLEKEVRHR
ncbi:DUF4350 domain-containing protein [Luteipulveratus mongoliensis]|uniref:DUF4350 domain-containing protein n=1 Tax=Luteipulveratus mongoliensis TaxID=571913 RepID=A0A0K1JHR9_9MICO|nr:DUF4350 domain-containing protein [Luteipulveratus mongoliensis]AKU16140.1 hypothetical protein VV02_10145 [Luteipulveratus mongoliensis]